MDQIQLLLFTVVLSLGVFIGFASAECTSPIYCQGPFLARIQSAKLFNDSKTFVDMPSKVPPAQVLQAFAALPNNASKEQLRQFVNQYFDQAGSDIESVDPSDWQQSPSFLSNITDDTLREWGFVIHATWKFLAKKFDRSKYCDDCYSSLNVDYPFVIAGDRFREFYYWDSYWIVKGLLVSEMYNTTKGMLLNFLSIVNQYGFVPNGGRVYYLNRSQPPLLTQMVRLYYEATGDLEFLQSALPVLDQEYQFWVNNRSVVVTVTNQTGTRTVKGINRGAENYALFQKLRRSSQQTFLLNRYDVTNVTPRPESYYEDSVAAEGMTPEQQENFYGQIATGAETGWDFSSRWFASKDTYTTIRTKEVIPVDLNSILFMNEITLSKFHLSFGDNTKALFYQKQAWQRKQAIAQLFWHPKKLQWYDFILNEGRSDNHFYPSNYVPLFAGCHDLDASTLQQLYSKLQDKQHPFHYPAGIPTSMYNTTQQWDFPNAWSPLQYFVIEGLNNLESDYHIDSKNYTQVLVERWVTTNYCAWNNTGGSDGGMMFEKYDATQVGKPGGGGEYLVQAGFGWTNGVILHLLQKYGLTLTLDAC